MRTKMTMLAVLLSCALWAAAQTQSNSNSQTGSSNSSGSQATSSQQSSQPDNSQQSAQPSTSSSNPSDQSNSSATSSNDQTSTRNNASTSGTSKGAKTGRNKGNLPATASPLPAISLLGIAFLGTGLWLSRSLKSHRV